MAHVRTTFGSLSCEVVQHGPEGSRPELAVVLCHGFGAPGDDLVPLGDELLRRKPALASRVVFVFPEAPIALGSMGFGYADSRAWWLIDMQRLMAVQMGDIAGMRLMRRETPEGLPRARRLLLGLVDELAKSLALPRSRVLLGGFSQGAMLTTDVALRLEEAPAGLAILSGMLLCEEDWAQRAPLRKGLNVFQSHGRQDPLLPFASADALRELLVAAGLSVEFLPFFGGHTIPLEAVERLAQFVEDALAPSSPGPG